MAPARRKWKWPGRVDRKRRPREPSFVETVCNGTVWWWMDYEGFMCVFLGGGVSGGWAGELEKVTVFLFSLMRGWD